MQAPLIIAEISSNHAGLYETAQTLIEEAAMAGAGAVKFQFWTKGAMAHPDAVCEYGAWKGRRLADLYDLDCYTPLEWAPDLFADAKRCGLQAFASAFDGRSLSMVESQDPSMHKVASFEVTDIGLVTSMARTGRHLVISAGAARPSDLHAAVLRARFSGTGGVTVLVCTSEYPASIADANLGRIPALRETLGCEIGLSDHTPGFIVPVVATALGVTMIEKHLKLPDAHTPDASAIGTAEAMPSERAQGLRRGLYFASDASKGTILRPEHFRAARPFNGALPGIAEHVIGRELADDVRAWDSFRSSLLVPTTRPQRG
jgi:pseudaminic acid synthase